MTSTIEGKQLTIHMGAMADPIFKQVKAQGFRIGKDWASLCDKLGHAITLLSIHDILTEKEASNARKRLLKRISSDVKSKN